MQRTRRTVLVSAVGICGFSGCLAGAERATVGDGASKDETTATEAIADSPVASATVSITTEDDLFDPPLVHLMRGGTITWTNDSEPDRDLKTISGRIPTDGDTWSETIPAGGSIELTVKREGVYDCSTESQSTVGRIVVGEPHVESEPAMNDDGENLAPPAAAALAELYHHTIELGGDGDCGCPK
ncbi:hypothetical protein [Halalkalirubrum salinum]|uniref:hypothetical protein n=1 Tax=Halalkalirubrum salinum TaxID=2563889 RepID=UPI0010FB33DF|nr:hypothetical protein [Halalkalirubrum salinum]